MHRQAVESGIVGNPENYPWTSYKAYIGEAPLDFLKPGVILEQFGSSGEDIRHYVEFVKGSDHGPVDWDEKSAIIVGDKKYSQEVSEQKPPVGQMNISDKAVFALIAEHFTIEPGLMVTPHGWEEKRLRQKIIRYLIDEVGLKPRRIMQLCHISRMTVQGALTKK